MVPGHKAVQSNCTQYITECTRKNRRLQISSGVSVGCQDAVFCSFFCSSFTVDDEFGQARHPFTLYKPHTKLHANICCVSFSPVAHLISSLGPTEQCLRSGSFPSHLHIFTPSQTLTLDPCLLFRFVSLLGIVSGNTHRGTESHTKDYLALHVKKKSPFVRVWPSSP